MTIPLTSGLSSRTRECGLTNHCYVKGQSPFPGIRIDNRIVETVGRSERTVQAIQVGGKHFRIASVSTIKVHLLNWKPGTRVFFILLSTVTAILWRCCKTSIN